MIKDDHYAVLGVGPTVGVAEIRRAYRRLALRHHPDRAGTGATALFQRIAEAYHVLSNAALRSSYDLSLRQQPQPLAWRPREWQEPAPGDAFAFDRRPGDPFGAARAAHHQARAAAAAAGAATSVIVRLSGPLDRLVAHAVARSQPGGVIELFLLPEEASSGGTAAIELPLTIPCPTCGGLAGKGRLWCRRCEFAGTIVDNVTLCVTIPPLVPDGTLFRIAGHPDGPMPPLAVRVRV